MNNSIREWAQQRSVSGPVRFALHCRRGSEGCFLFSCFVGAKHWTLRLLLMTKRTSKRSLTTWQDLMMGLGDITSLCAETPLKDDLNIMQVEYDVSFHASIYSIFPIWVWRSWPFEQLFPSCFFNDFHMMASCDSSSVVSRYHGRD